ncbi:MAG: lytic murein transglycosylase [Bdellovibrionota bacterium]
MPRISRFCTLSLIFLLGACSAAPLSSDRHISSFGPAEYASEKLRTAGINEDFLQLLLSNYREDQRAKVLDLNLLGFLRSSTATGDEKIPGWELAKVEKFLKAHRKEFSYVEKNYPVPKEVIASLLWVETKHGKDVGTYHVGSALLSLVEADFPTILDQTLDSARKKCSEYTPVIEAKIVERSHSKSTWAVSEIIALQEVHRRGLKDVTKLHGSFSGAFGMAQFLPSSYLTWAKGNKKEPNLFKADDSILSVANYLSSNGWTAKDKTTQEAALFHYNRDKAYVTRILKMSNCLKKTHRSKRKVASTKSC